MQQQLMLPLGIVPSSSFDTYYVSADNALLVKSIRAFAAGELDDRQLLLWGEHGAGKSHLLSAACQHMVNDGYRIAYLPAALASYPEALDGLEACDLVCIDDVHKLSGDAEESLFHCINRCRQADTRMLFASSFPLERLDVELADLRTRLGWGLVIQLVALAGEDCRRAVAHIAQARSMRLENDVLDYLLRHFPRDMPTLANAIDKLDEASMSEKRMVTIPLLQRVLQASVS